MQRVSMWMALLLVCANGITSQADTSMSLVIGIDGLGYGSQGLSVAHTPNLDRLMAGTWMDGYASAFSETAIAGGILGTASQQTTVSGPGWSTILSGVWTDRHGVTGNTFSGARFETNPTYLETLEEQVQGLVSVSIVNWDPIDTFIISSVDDANSRMDVRETYSSDVSVAAALSRQIGRLDSSVPSALFVGFDEVDGAGHSCGSSGACYRNAIQEVDQLVGVLLDTVTRRTNFANEDWQIIVTADHGHRAGGGHGGQSSLERTIPFIVSSRDLANGELHDPMIPISHADVAPTVLDHFGIAVPGHYAGASRAAGSVRVLEPVETFPQVILFYEDFESLTLGPNVEEDIGRPVDSVWTKMPPQNWSIEDAVPGQDEGPGNNGVTEWIGWSFTDKDWWIDVAGDQQRSEFTLGQGTVAVADPDEWDDAPHPDSESAGWYNSFLSTPEISVLALRGSEVTLEFDSSWRDEFDSNYRQTANVTVSFDGRTATEVLRWESDPGSPYFKDDATNETVRLAIDVPANAEAMQLTFGLFDAGNDWWWAIDNISISGVVRGDFNGDGLVDATDIDLMVGAIQDGNTQFDLNGDQQMDLQDQNELVTGILNTWIGDSNLDGSFDSSDFVLVFAAGKFETEAAATWSEGDWNADGLFNSADLVRAFSDGGFERGMRSVQSVPEPNSFVQLVGLLVGWVWVRKCRE